MNYDPLVEITRKLLKSKPEDVNKDLTEFLRVKHMKYDTFVDLFVKELENKTNPKIISRLSPEERLDLARKLKAINPIREAFKGLLTPEQWGQIKSSLDKYPTIAKLIGKN